MIPENFSSWAYFTSAVTKSNDSFNEEEAFINLEIFSLADSCAGYGCVRSLPEGAAGFTTIETKTNFLSTVRQGSIQAIAIPLHRGKSTQVWDTSVSSTENRQLLSCYRCTQMVLWPKTNASSKERVA